MDVAGLDEAHDINWPGIRAVPAVCTNRTTWFWWRRSGPQPTVYAHVAKEIGKPGIAVQYWYNYYYNDFANKHEGDWEMVQVMFDDANIVEEAFQQEPTRTAYSGHSGGEIAYWTDAKLEKIDGRPRRLRDHRRTCCTLLGGHLRRRRQARPGLRCDPTTGPHRTVDPKLVLLPDEPPPPGSSPGSPSRGSGARSPVRCSRASPGPPSGSAGMSRSPGPTTCGTSATRSRTGSWASIPWVRSAPS